MESRSKHVRSHQKTTQKEEASTNISPRLSRGHRQRQQRKDDDAAADDDDGLEEIASSVLLPEKLPLVPHLMLLTLLGTPREALARAIAPGLGADSAADVARATAALRRGVELFWPARGIADAVGAAADDDDGDNGSDASAVLLATRGLLAGITPAARATGQESGMEHVDAIEANQRQQKTEQEKETTKLFLLFFFFGFFLSLFVF